MWAKIGIEFIILFYTAGSVYWVDAWVEDQKKCKPGKKDSKKRKDWLGMTIVGIILLFLFWPILLGVSKINDWIDNWRYR